MTIDKGVYKMADIIQHGEPGHPSEQTVAEYLRDNLPASYQVHYALKLSFDQTDYDCIVVAPHAVYVIEIKAYGGKIVFDSENFKWILSNGEKKPVALNQATRNSRKLHTMLQEYYIGFKDVPVQEVVCLYAETKPVVQLPQDQRRLTLWYRELPGFLQNRSRLARKWLDINLTDYFDIIEQGLATGFDRPKWIRDYKIESCVWITSDYRGYAASSPHFPNQHILKVYDFPNDVSEDTVRKFIDDLERERNALKLVVERGDLASGGKEHVIVFDEAFYVKARNQYVVVMNWVKGDLLSTLMHHFDKVPRKDRFTMAAQMCRGLQFVHSADIIHRGLHPENIVRGKDGSIKLVNFNFAKFTNPPATTGFETMRQDNFLLNRWIKDVEKTRRYLAPELLSVQKDNEGSPGTVYSRATRETDLFSLGVILWELFAEENYPGPQAESLDKKANLPIEIATPLTQMIATDAEDRKKVDLLDVAEIFEQLASGTPLDHRSLPALKPGQKFEGFETEEELATTLMSRTYRAKDKFGDGKVVIKFLRSTSTESALDEMNRAWNILRDLNQAYTARLIDGDRVYVRNGTIQNNLNGAQVVYYQVFEFLEGMTLRELISDGSVRADRQKLKRVIFGLLEAVQAVHQADWMHLDIKPENFILTKEGRVKIIDFGLSRRVNSSGDLEAYSPGYTPPEVRRSQDRPEQPWTPAGDVYSTAYVIVALICGEPEPKGPVLNPEQVQAFGGAELLELLQKDTSNDPADRSQSAIAMYEKYKPVIENFQPVSPDPAVMPAEASTTSQPQESLMDQTKVQEWIDELLGRANAASDPVQFDRLQKAADQLHIWQEQGLLGKCPVDLSPFGLDPKATSMPMSGGPESPPLPPAISEDDPELTSVKPPAASEPALNEQGSPLPATPSPISPKADISEAERGSMVARLVAKGEQEMQKIENEVEGADFARIYEVIADLRMLDSNSPDASNLERELAVYEHRKVLRRLKEDLLTLEDSGPLNDRINTANQIVSEGKGDLDLEALINKAIERRNTIRKFQGELTTQDALADLDGLNKVWTELEASRQKGLTTFFDQRNNQDRLLTEFRSEVEQKRALLALEAVTKIEVRALGHMPDEGTRHPKRAIEELELALSISGQSNENKKRLQRLLTDEQGPLQESWQEQARKWDKADALLAKSYETNDILQKLNLVRRARQVYPYHEVTQDLKRLMTSACASLKERLRQSIELGENELQNAPTEAERLRRQNSAQPLQSFYNARRPVNEVLLLLAELQADERTDELKEQVKLADAFLKRVDRAEEHRRNIAADYVRIHAYIDRSDKKAAQEAYDALQDDFRADPEIRYLREQMDQFLGVEELVQEARRYRKTQMWEDCRRICDQIDQKTQAERQGFQTELNQIRAEANLYIHEQNIRQALEGSYYEQAATLIKKFDLEGDAGQESLKRALSEALDLQVARKDLHARQTVDRQFSVRQQWEKANKELASLETKLAKVKEANSETGMSEYEIVRAVQLHDLLNDLRVAESSYKGVLRDGFARSQTVLHDFLAHELQRHYDLYLGTGMEERKKFDYEPAYHKARLMVEKKLAYVQDSDRRRWALLGYFDQQEREISDPEQKVKNWEIAYEQFPEPVFRRRMREAQLDYLVHVLDQCLQAQDYERVEKLLSRAEILPAYSQPFNYDQYEEPRLEVRKQFADILKQNAALDTREDYFGIVLNYDGLLTTLDGLEQKLVGDLQAIARKQRSQVVEQSVNKLLEKGERLSSAAGSERDIPGAMGAYAAALQLNPDHLRVRTIIKNNAGEIILQSDRAIQEAQSARSNIGQDNLSARIDEYSALAIRLRSLAAACLQLRRNDKAEEIERVLEGGTDNLLKVLRELEECQKLLKHIDPDGPVWKNQCLGEGNWDDANKVLQKLRQSIIGGGHKAALELDERIELHREVRNSMNKLKEEIRDAIRNDDFNNGLDRCDKIDHALNENMVLNGIAPSFPPVDPYKIIPKDWREFDLFTRKRIPYFGDDPNPPMPVEPDVKKMTLRQVFEVRKNNLRIWEAVHKTINGAHLRLVEPSGSMDEIRPRRQPNQPTRNQLDQVLSYLEKSRLALEACRQLMLTTAEPLSRVADTLRRTCQRLLEEMESEHNLAGEDRRDLEEDEKLIQHLIDMAVDALEKNQDSEASDHISAANDFYQDSEHNPNREFIQHLSEVLMQTSDEN
jgi:serine/threonine protein kinase